MIGRLFLFFLLCCVQFARAQSIFEKPNVQLIGTEEGLPFGTTSLIQDKVGYIWLATSDGLYRYDGYNFLKINFNRTGGYALPNEVIISLSEDNDGNIWMGLMGGFVARFNPVTNSIAAYRTDPITSNDINKIFCDGKGNVFISAWSQGLFKFNGKDKFEHVGSLDQLPQKSSRDPGWFNAIGAFHNEDDKLWLGTVNGLQYLDKASNKIIKVNDFNPESDQFPYTVQTIAVQDSIIWCGTYGGGLIKFNKLTGKWKRYLFQEGPPGTNNIIYSVIPKDESEIWIATSSKGIAIFNKLTEKFTFYYEQQNLDSGPLAFAMIKTNNGALLMLSDRGLHKWDYEQESFRFYKVPVLRSDNSAYYLVLDVLERKSNKDLFIGLAFANGLAIQSPNKPIRYRDFKSHKFGEPYLLVRDIMEDKKGDVWVLTRDALYKVSKDDQLIEDISLSEQFAKDQLPSLTKILEADNGALWVTSSANGIFRKDPQTNKWTHFSTDNNTLVNNRIFDAEEDNDGKLWFLHYVDGVSVYDPETKTFTNPKHNHANVNSLISERVTDITRTSDGKIWISTYEGVSVYSHETKSFRHFNNKNGLPTNNIYSIEADDNDNVWLVTSIGATVILANNKGFLHYDFLDGLKAGDSKLSKGNNDKMFVSTFQGFYVFRPSNLINRKRKPSPIVITEIKHQDVKLSGIQNTSQIEIPYSQNSIEIDFASLNYFNPLQNKYEYMMVGLDKQWNATQSHHVNYSGLPSGNFTFKVRNQADPKDVEASLLLKVTTPFWKQSWFVLTWFCCLAVSGYWLYHLRLSKIRKEEAMKADFKQKLAEVEMKALRSQMSPHFIFNSLNSINRYIIKSDPDTASLYLTKFSKLIRLILDNSNHKIISLEQELLAIKLYIELESLRFNQKFKYSLTVDPDLNPLSIGVPPMIIQPFVENAIWHGLLHKETPGMLKIWIERYGHGIQCVIEDDGVGRERAKELKSKSVSQEKSYGMKITADRLEMLNQDSNVSSIEIIDMKDEQGNALGTRVLVRIMAADIEPEF